MAYGSVRMIAFTLLIIVAAPSGCRRAERFAHPGLDKFVADEASVLEQQSIGHLNEYLGALLRDADIEVTVLSVPSLNGQTIQSLAGEVFEAWKVGRRSRANRGVLFLMAVREQQVRFAVSYGLESVFPDAFISYIEHEQMLPYFKQGTVRIGFEAAVEMIAGRGFKKIEQKEYDPMQIGQQTVMGHHQGGAGAQMVFDQNSAAKGGNEVNLAQDVRAYFSAQPSAEQAWQRFLELNSRRISDPDLGLYTENSKQMIRTRPMTPAGMDLIAQNYRGQNYSVKEKDDRAVVLFPDDANHMLAPWFFLRGPSGWQFDGRTFFEIVGFNHRNQWHFRQTLHPYAFAFENYSFDRNGFAFRRKPRVWLGCTWYWANYEGSGVLVTEVQSGTPAEAAGIEVGDYIMSIDGRAVAKPAELSSAVRNHQAGDRVKLVIVRGALAAPVQVRYDNGEWKHVVARTVLSKPQHLTVEAVLSMRE